MDKIMSKLLKQIIVLVIFYGSTIAIEDDYNGYKKFNVQHSTENIYNYMVQLQLEVDKLDFWLITKNSSTVIVPPELQNDFIQNLNAKGAVYDASFLKMNMIEDEADCFGEFCPLKRQTRQSSGSFFRSFPRYDAILQFMYALARRHPQFVRYESIGRSAEGRSIGALSISLSRHSHRLAYIQGGVHAREWISPTTVLYFATELVSNIQYYRRILHDIEVYIVPVVNPDGYEYSHLRDRLWRKNRHAYAGFSCRGVDINRNFGLYWNYIGSSQNLCSEIYSGQRAHSEPETQAVKNYLERNRHRAKLVLDLHSYGKYLFYPWGYTRQPVAARSFLHSVGLRAANAIAKYRGTIYQVGTSAGLLYEASGGLDDYAYGVLGIPLSYTIELPGNGFQIPTSEIIPVGKETFAGLIEFIRHTALV